MSNKLFDHKFPIPLNTLLFVGQVLPMVSVLQGSLEYTLLVLLFYFEHMALMLLDICRVFSAPVQFPDVSAFNNEKEFRDKKRNYILELRIAFLAQQFFLGLILSILITIPLAMFPRVTIVHDHLFSNTQLLIILTVLMMLAHIIKLIQFYSTPFAQRPVVEEISKVDFEQYTYLFMIIVVGAVAVAYMMGDENFNQQQVIVYTVGITFIKLFGTFRSLKKGSRL